MKKSFFLSFEGIDGCGKSTQVLLLQKALERKGYHVRTFREPGSSRIGRQVRKILLDPKNTSITRKTEGTLFMAVECQNVEEILLPALKKGYVVIADRFYDSSRAFQHGVRGVPMKVLDTLKKILVGPIEPKLTFLLDIPTKLSVERSRKRDRGGDRIERESLKHHEKARKAFLRLAKKYPKRIKVIDATKSISDIHKEVMKIVNKRI
ncbi:MAG: dTMP kinase [Nanoarchaeota archaeon]